MTLRLGYMVPEFPGQTHIFFWREILELRKKGVDVRLVSTRQPSKHLRIHDWTNEAIRQTLYLHPLKLSLAKGLSSINPINIMRCISMIMNARDISHKERVRLLGLLPFALRLAIIAKNEKWHHIHSHFHFNAADIVLFGSILSGVPYSISRHGLSIGYGNQRNKWKHASFGTVVTEYMMKELCHDLRDIELPKIYVLAMGVDVDMFSRKKPYRPWNRKGKLQLFSCGRLDHQKGHDLTIKMVAEIRNRGIDAELRIAGALPKVENEYVTSLKDLVIRENLQDSVTFLGALPEKVVIEELENTHIFVLASHGEALGVVYIEAMSMEVPTIGCRDGGVPTLIEDKTTGFLVPPHDPNSLADTVEWIIEHPNEAKNIGHSGRAFIVNNYTSKRGAETLLNAVLETHKTHI